jgi:hypothetical protein
MRLARVPVRVVVRGKAVVVVAQGLECSPSEVELLLALELWVLLLALAPISPHIPHRIWFDRR